MKPLPILSSISALSFGLATQLKMGSFIVIDDEFKLSPYDVDVQQIAFKVDNDCALIAYTAFKSDPFLDIMVNVTHLYDIVKNYFGDNFNSTHVSKTLTEFASVFNATDKEKIFSLSFKEIEGSMMLVKRFHPGFFKSYEEVCTGGVTGMICGFARSIYKDVVLSLQLSDDDKTYIYKVLSSINTVFPES